MAEVTGEAPAEISFGSRPSAQAHVLDRRRLLALIDSGFEAGPYVEILAAPGWGKSTVASQYVERAAGPVAWISCVGDGAAALGPLLQTWDRGSGLDLTVVLDDAQELVEHERGRSALRRMADLRPTGARVLVCTSRHLGRVLNGPRGGPVLITESDLRLTARDARRLQSVVPVADLLRDTGGWVAGALLLGQGPQDPRATVRLHRLIRSAVLDRLTEPERRFLSQAAILPVITPGDARALLGEEAVPLLHSIRRRVLPLMHITDDAIICRRPLREELLADLSRHDEDQVDRLSTRHLEHLRTTGRMREAVEWCIAAGDRIGAVRVIEQQIATLPNRTPSREQLGEWLESLGPDTALGSDVLAAAAIRRLHQDRRIHEAAAVIRRLIGGGRMDAILRTNPDLHAVVLWCLHDQPRDALPYTSPDLDHSSYQIEAVSFMVSVLGANRPVDPPLQASWGELSALVHWGLIWQGKLDEVIDSSSESPAALDDNPNAVIAALWSRRPDFARQVLSRIPRARADRPQVLLARAMVELVDGHLEEAERLLFSGREDAQRNGNAGTFEVLHAYLLLRMGRHGHAIRLLSEQLPLIQAGGHLAVAEWGRMVSGMAHLAAGDPVAARSPLEEALSGMRSAGRLLLATATERLLAEAKLADGGDVDDVLRDASGGDEAGRPDRIGHIGSSYWEQEVAALTPRVTAVLAGRRETRSVGPLVVTPRTEAVLYPFGDPPVLEIGDNRIVLRRLKVVELIADMALHDGAMDRDALQQRLFPEIDRRRASNYFRQVVFKIRELIGVSLRREKSLLIWPGEIPLRSIDLDFERRIAAVSRSSEGAGSIRDTFDLASAPYLPASELPWVVERRNHLSLLYERAVVAELNAAFGRGELDLIRDYGARAIALNPYAEDLYLLMVRAEQQWGSVARGRATFRAAHESMKDLGVDVSDELREAAQKLGASE